MNDFEPEDLERITARAEEMLARAERLRGEIDVVVGRGEAADGQVRVTAGASGRVMDVVLAPRAMRMDSLRLAEAVLRAAQEAQDDAAAKVDATLAGTLGGGPRADGLDDRFAGLLDSLESSLDEQLHGIQGRPRESP